jgi:hypothetical protein
LRKESGLSQIYREWGYEIHRNDGETLLIDRRTWPLPFPIAIFAGIAVVLIGIGLVQLLMPSFVERPLPTGGVLLGFGVAVFFILTPIWGTYKRRRDLPVEEITDGLIIDSATGVLRHRDGEVLSQLDALGVETRRDWWWTRGVMKLVVLTWAGQKRVVFRTVSGRRARELREMLRGVVTGGPSRRTS